VNIAGKPYLTDKGLADFMPRVEAGEFAERPNTPNKDAAVNNPEAKSHRDDVCQIHEQIPPAERKK